MNEDKNKPYIPIEEMLSFLVVARTECINSIILEDFFAKMTVLKQQANFSELLSRLEEKPTAVAIRILKKLDIVSIFSYCNSKEIMLLDPATQTEIWESKHTNKDYLAYLSVVQAYRTTEIDLSKTSKIKK